MTGDAPQVALSRKSPYVETPHKVSGLMMANHTSIGHVSRQGQRERGVVRVACKEEGWCTHTVACIACLVPCLRV